MATRASPDEGSFFSSLNAPLPDCNVNPADPGVKEAPRAGPSSEDEQVAGYDYEACSNEELEHDKATDEAEAHIKSGFHISEHEDSENPNGVGPLTTRSRADFEGGSPASLPASKYRASSPVPPEFMLPEEEWRAIQPVGQPKQGRFGVVRFAVHHNQPVVVKTYKNASFQDPKKFDEEVHLTWLLSGHQNTCRFVGAFSAAPQSVGQRPEGLTSTALPALHMVLKREDQTLHELLQQPDRLEPHTILTIAKGICEGMQHIHDKDVLHCDLKPDNILLNQGGEAVLCDYGLSLSLVPGESLPKLVRGHHQPKLYAAPEVVRGSKFSFQSDIFSFGCCVAAMLAPNPFTLSVLKGMMEAPATGLLSLVQKACQEAPAARFQSFQEICQEIIILQLTAKD